MKEGFVGSLAQKSKEVGIVIGAGTIAWIAFFGMTNPALVTHILAGAGALYLGGEVYERNQKPT